MSSAPDPVYRAVIHNEPRHAHRIGRQADQPARAESVAQVFIPFVTDGFRPYGGGLTGRLVCDCGVTPETKLPQRFRDLDLVLLTAVHSKNRTDHRILRFSPVSGRTEPLIAPLLGPRVREWVDLGVGIGLLITYQSPIRGFRSIDAVLPASLPKHYVPTEERQVDACVAGGFYVSPLSRRPVFVVTHRQKYLVLQDLSATPVGVNPGKITHVVAVRLQPARHRVLGIEYPRITELGMSARVERPVIAHLVAPAGP